MAEGRWHQGPGPIQLLPHPHFAGLLPQSRMAAPFQTGRKEELGGKDTSQKPRKALFHPRDPTVI